MSLKRFDGWEPTTTYTHNGQGQVVSSVPELEWDAQEQGWILALLEYRKGFCAHCGGDLEETTDPRTEDGYEHLPPTQCNRCVQFERAREQYKDEPHSFTLMHSVRLRSGVRRGGT